jgi:uncharacterized protein YndB with AHSA1/START domain
MQAMRLVLNVLKIVVALLMALVALTGIIGLLLPKAHEVTRSARVEAPIRAIYSMIITPEAYPEWRPDVARVERMDSDRFREFGENGPMIFRIVQRDPPSRVVVAVDDPDQPFSGTWTIELAEEGEPGQSTRIRITERGEVPNPFFRAIARAMMLPTDSIDAYLRNMGRRFNQDVTIEP